MLKQTCFFVLLAVIVTLISCATVPSHRPQQDIAGQVMRLEIRNDGAMIVTVNMLGQITTTDSFNYFVVVFPGENPNEKIISFSENGENLSDIQTTIKVPLIAFHQLAEYFDIVHLRVGVL